MTRLHCWPVPTLNQIRHFIFLVQVLHRTPICVLTWVYESCTKFLVTGLSCPKLFGNLLNALWGKKKRLLLNASKHSPECFLLCLNRLSVTKKKHMLLVPKYFVTVPDDDPEILINLSHPWTAHLYMHAFSTNRLEIKSQILKWMCLKCMIILPPAGQQKQWCWNEYLKNWEAVYFTDIYRD